MSEASFIYRLLSVNLSRAILKSFMCFVLNISQSRIFQKSIIHPVKLLFLLDLSEFSHSTLFSASWIFLTCCLYLSSLPWPSDLGGWHISSWLMTSHSPNSVSLWLFHCCPSFLLISLIAFLWTLFPSTRVLFRK